jgi:site-specific recombinase XerD
LRAWLNFSVKEELLNASPMRRVGMPRLDRRILPAFAPDDVTRLLEACTPNRERSALLFLLDTGIRASEFVALDSGHIDVQTGTVRIVQGKGRKDRIAFRGSEARKALLRY